MGQRPPPLLLPCTPSHLTYIPTIRSLFGWLLCTPIQQKPLKSEAPSPSLFSHFSLLYPSPKRMSKPPPPHITLVRISSPTLPPPPTPLFGWLLYRTIEQRPSKTGVLPVSQFLDWGHYSDPNKGNKCSACKLDRRAPLLGSWGAVAPQFESMADVATEGEGKAAGCRVSRG